MNSKEYLIQSMQELHSVLTYYLEHPFDEDTHITLNDTLYETQYAMKKYFDNYEPAYSVTIIEPNKM